MEMNAQTKAMKRCFMRDQLIAALLMSALAGAAAAQDADSSGAATNPPPSMLANAVQYSAPINQAGSFGLGALGGEPSGVSAKVWLSGTTAVDAGAGWSFVDPDGFQLHGDFLFHKFNLFHVGTGELPLYFGVGGRVKFVEHGENRAGIRGPVGLSYFIPNSHLELFAEVAPILDVAPTTSVEWNGGVGLRYYFH
jgi:hypothetical protein